MRVRQQGSRTLRKTILIYCEGETERIYFEQMRILKRSKMVSVKIKTLNVQRSNWPNMLIEIPAINTLMRFGLFLIRMI